VETIEEILELARLSRVTITEACKESGVSNNTISRWKKGVQPRPAKYFAFREAVIILAYRNKSLPVVDISRAFIMGVRKLLELMK
jgi:transcriptional regulator with XRE-family HTH domain